MAEPAKPLTVTTVDMVLSGPAPGEDWHTANVLLFQTAPEHVEP